MVYTINFTKAKELFLIMMSLHLHTTIKKELLKKNLFRGSLIAISGLVIIWLSYFLLPSSKSSLLWVIGALFIAYGLIPYKRISQLQIHPHTLEISSEGVLYSQKNKHLFIPWAEVTSAHFIETGSWYGICLVLKEEKYMLPYFSRRSFDRLQEWREHLLEEGA